MSIGSLTATTARRKRPSSTSPSFRPTAGTSSTVIPAPSYVLEGEGLHLTDGEPVRLRKGDLVFIPKGEWHGFANDSDDPTLAVTVMGGVAHYSDAGYEVPTT
jgi:glyoxylate utilization-related uncharacterized protein